MTDWRDEWLEGVTPPTVDLHLHTTASDGLLTPAGLIEAIANSSIEIAAVCDHDSTDGLDEAFKAAARFPRLRLIPGVELSTYIGESEIHMVGLFIDYKSAVLQERLAEFRSRRERAITRTVEKLNDLGIAITLDQVKSLANGAIGRPHIADAMIQSGYIQTRDEAFEKYLGEDGPARVHRTPTATAEGIALIHEVGGVAVVAHPRTVKVFELVLPRLADEGIDGIEVFAEKYGAEDRQAYAEMAKQYNLVPAGGSDYHAKGTEDEIVPGSPERPGPPPAIVDALERRAAAVRAGATA